MARIGRLISNKNSISLHTQTDGYERGPGDDDADGKKGGFKRGKGRLPDAENELEKVNLKKVPGKKAGKTRQVKTNWRIMMKINAFLVFGFWFLPLPKDLSSTASSRRVFIDGRGEGRRRGEKGRPWLPLASDCKWCRIVSCHEI